MPRAPLSRRMGLHVASALALVVTDAGAAADDEACFSAAANGQRARNQGQLLRARSAFERCASATCDPKVVHRCSEWLAQAIEITPSVVLSAQDGASRDVVDVEVFLDGVHVASATKGTAIPVDPGVHEVRFVKAGTAPVTQSVLVHEGEKARLVRVVFTDEPSATTPAGRPVPASVYVLAGVGVLAIGTSAWFTVSGLEDRAAFGCAVGCSEEEARSTRRTLLVADISGAVAVGALGAAAWLFLTRPLVAKGPIVTVQPNTGGATAALTTRF